MGPLPFVKTEPYCLVPSCTSEQRGHVDDVAFFSFPTSTGPATSNSLRILKETRNLWLGIIRILRNDPNWDPTTTTCQDRICARHFKPTDIIVSSSHDDVPRLTWTAVPCLQLGLESNKSSSPVPSVRLFRNDPLVKEAVRKKECSLCQRQLRGSLTLTSIEASELKVFLDCCMPTTKGIEVHALCKKDDCCCNDCKMLINQVCSLKWQMDKAIRKAKAKLGPFLNKAAAAHAFDQGQGHNDCHANCAGSCPPPPRPHAKVKSKRPRKEKSGGNQPTAKRLRVSPTMDGRLKLLVLKPETDADATLVNDDIKEETLDHMEEQLEDAMESNDFEMMTVAHCDIDDCDPDFSPFLTDCASSELDESTQIPVNGKKKNRRQKLKSNTTKNPNPEIVLPPTLVSSTSNNEDEGGTAAAGETVVDIGEQLLTAGVKVKSKSSKSATENNEAQKKKKPRAKNAVVLTVEEKKELKKTSNLFCPYVGRNFPFKCYLNNCEQSYKNNADLVVHQRRDHFNQRPFTCGVCQKTCHTVGELKKHKLWGHPEVGGSYHCQEDNCTEKFSSLGNLRRHLEMVHDFTVNQNYRMPPTPCPICGFTSKVRLYVHNHIRKMHPFHKLVHCATCNRQLVSTEELESHHCKPRIRDKDPKRNYYNQYARILRKDLDQNEINQEINRVNCTECQFSFLSQDDLKSNHLNEDGKCPDPSSICDVCGDTIPKRRFSRHMSDHRCLYDCEATFNNVRDRWSHMKTVHGYKPKPQPPSKKKYKYKSKTRPRFSTLPVGQRQPNQAIYLPSWGRNLKWKCDYEGCECSFQEEWLLKDHINGYHLRQRPHECEVCGKRFLLVCHRNTHRRTQHPTPEELQFPCDWPDCTKAFVSQHFLDRHKNFVHIKPFGCDVCGKKFANKAFLGYHSTVHTGKKNFECTVCQQRFQYPYQAWPHKHKCLPQPN